MIKKQILSKIVRDNDLLDTIFFKFKYRQATMAQSFKRTLNNNKISGKSHDPEVLKVICIHLGLTLNQLLD